MGISKTGLLALAAAGVIMAGCQSSRFDGGSSNPGPLRPAPVGGVQKGTLQPANPSHFPAAPTTNSGSYGDPSMGGSGVVGADSAMNTGNQQVASLPPANAAEITPGAVAGVWNASLGGQSCKIATPQTKFGQGYRAGPLRCPGELSGLASWAVKGSQLVLYDAAGGTVATLYSAGGSRFDGQTSGGQSVSLSR